MPLPPGVRQLFRPARLGVSIEQDVSEELDFHLAARRAELEAQGLDASAARAEAEREFGDLSAARAELTNVDRRRERRARGAEWRESVVQDVRYAIRGMRRAPGFSVVVLLTMALGIGANTAVFSVVNALLLNPISYRDPGRLAMLWRQTADRRLQLTPSSEMIAAWRANAREFEGIESFSHRERTLTGRGDAITLHTGSVSATFARFAGVQVVRGRGFGPDDVVEGAPAVALLSEALWKQRFGSDESVIGTTITLDEKPVVLIGVASGAWRLPSMTQTRTDLWMPLRETDLKYGAMTIGRLKPKVTPEAASLELDRVLEAGSVDNKLGGVPVHSYAVLLSKSVWFRKSLLILSGAVVLLLLVTCANIAHLLLARGAVRERELAVRRALGATRSRIIRQQLVESLIIAVGGCLLGVGVAYAGLRLLVALRPERLEALTLATLDPTVLGFAVLASIATGMTFGLIGAASAGRAGVLSLRSGVGSSTGGPSRHGLRGSLVVTEMALSTVLLVIAMLLVRTVFNLQQVNPGFDANGLYAMDFTELNSRAGDTLQSKDYARRLLEAVRAIPGIAAATTSGSIPPGTSGVMFGEWEAEGQTVINSSMTTQVNQVRPEYFSTIRMSLSMGHAFDAGSNARNEVIVNEAMAKRLFGASNPIGGHFRAKTKPGEKGDQWYTVAGVAPNTAAGSLIIEAETPAMYFPSEYGTDWGHLTVSFRIAPNNPSSAAVLQAVARAAKTIDPAHVPPRIVPVREALLETVATQRFMMLLMIVFAAMALLLSGIGLYGVIAWSVAQRTREIGIRVALGGTRAHIARLVLRSGLLLSSVGLAAGLLLSASATRVVESQLYGIGASDPLSYVAGGGLLMTVALLSCLAPLRRATGVTPLVAMRAE